MSKTWIRLRGRILNSASLLGGLVLWATDGAALGGAQSPVYSVSSPILLRQGFL
jgi:hypothetical protein